MCGAVNFTVNAEKAVFNIICHCKACARSHGTYPLHILAVPKDGLKITKGEEDVKVVNKIGTLQHAFCS